MRFNFSLTYDFGHFLGRIILLIVFIFIPFIIIAQDIETMILAEEDSVTYRLKAINCFEKSEDSKKNGDYKQAQLFALKGIRNMYKYNAISKDSSQMSINILHASLIRSYAVSSYYLGDYVQALVFYDKTIAKLKQIELDSFNQVRIYQIKARCYNGKATIFSTQGIISKALDNFLKALQMYELNKDSAGIAKLNNNIGILYKNQGKYNEAENYFSKALEIYMGLNEESSMSTIYNNMGLLFVRKNDPDKALGYLEKAKQINERLLIYRSLSHTYHNIGKAYVVKGAYRIANSFFEKAIKIQIENSDERALLDSYLALAESYSQLGDVPKARKYLNKSEKLNEKLTLLPVEVNIYKLYFEIYNSTKRKEKALHYHILYKNSSDSLKQKEQLTEASRIQLTYQLKKKEQEFEVLNKQRELNEILLSQRKLSERRQTIIIIVVLVLLMLALVFVHMMFRRLQLNRKQQLIIQNQKMEMDDKNRILKNAYEEINQQKAEILKQRNALSGQKEKAFSLFNDLRSSIVYAKHIQSALLPDNSQLEEIFSEYFVFNQPHSIVSGDFYWGNTVNDWRVFAVADCTGHGVPGALMSMLGITFLNEIVKYKDVNNTGIVLGYLRKYIVNALRSADSNKNNRDGMDISVIAKKINSKEMFFSGANSNIYIIRSSSSPLIVNSQIISPTMKNSNSLLFELKGDRMPIGFDEEMNEFTSYSFEIEETDQIYLFTDGFADQFGGDDNKKLKYKKFKEIILENSSSNLIEQKVRISNYLNDWMGENRQVDDILVVGGKIIF